MRTRLVVAPALAVALAVAVGGCTDGGDDEPGAAPTPSTVTSTSPTGSPSATATAGPFDCEAVSAAQRALNDASTAELDRLGIGRGDQQAFTVTLLVASQEALPYWQAVDAAATPQLTGEQRADLDAVTGYWSGLDPALEAIEVADGSPDSVRVAGAELTAVTQSATDETQAAAQQRLQDLLATTCGVSPAAP